MVAIKRLEEHASDFNFNSELQLAGLHHINLIRLLGWCVHEKERILVYEFMRNGSLDRSSLVCFFKEHNCLRFAFLLLLLNMKHEI
jgi:hypothetical protein